MKGSNSWKVPGSKKKYRRSRAVSFPLECWRSMLASPPPFLAFSLISCSFRIRGSSWVIVFQCISRRFGIIIRVCFCTRLISIPLRHAGLRFADSFSLFHEKSVFLRVPIFLSRIQFIYRSWVSLVVIRSVIRLGRWDCANNICNLRNDTDKNYQILPNLSLGAHSLHHIHSMR
jgi:hypothetical protein